jgi:acetyltransferase
LNGLNASFANGNALKGDIAFISQSGALCTAMLDWANKNKIGFSSFISIGSMVDVCFHDLIDYFKNDEKTKSILIYMESLSEAEAFQESARKFSLKKPIIVMKSGKSRAGAKAAMSHTGSLAGDNEAYDAVFKKCGVMRINTIRELYNSAKILSVSAPKSNKLAIITNAGGPGVLAADCLSLNNGVLANLSKKSLEDLNKILPSAWSKSNPVDVLGDADSDRYKKALKIVFADINVDGVLIILTPQAMTHPLEVAQEIINFQNKVKPVMASFMGEDDVQDARNILQENNIPVFDTPEEAIKTYLNFYEHAKSLRKKFTNLELIKQNKINYKIADDIMDKALEEDRKALNEIEAKKILQAFNIPILENYVCKNKEEVLKNIKKLSFPLAMKILSEDIIHKTDVGGVRLNINSEKEAEKAYDKIIASVKKHKPRARIEGVIIEPIIKRQIELILGMKRDPLFGSLIVFGRGGVEVELYNDVSHALAPLDTQEIIKLIKNTKVYSLIKGYRNMKGADINELKRIINNFSTLIEHFPEIKEFDINPLTVLGKKMYALDAKIILE